MSNHPKISDHHRRRQAVVYIRQSTLQQVSEHLESQRLQYELAERAVGLGWPAAQVSVIDEDLGKSAVSRVGRSGFERLFADVGAGQVGLLLVTDVSRLARNCADWYQLLDLAAWRGTLIGDSGGIYDPTAYDDRLLLGVKGAFSEAQWHIMRQQLQAARLNKARRGELALCLPVGYDRLPNGTVVKTADMQVQSALTGVFNVFAQTGSARAVLRRLLQQGLLLPRRRRNALGAWTIVWTPPGYGQIYQLLTLPTYAGVYAYGQRQRTRSATGTQYGGRLPPAQWQVQIHDKLPAYISWEQYMANRQQLADNWRGSRFAADGSVTAGRPYAAAGMGRALLQGLVRCGHCGRRMRVRYKDKPAYVCEATKQQFNAPRCQYTPHAPVDQAVVAHFLAAIQPAALQAALSAGDTAAADQQQLTRQWQQQLARAAHAVEVARLRYEQVDPTLRLVAAELERQWETALTEQQRLQQQWAALQTTLPAALSAADMARIQQLAADLPALWSAAATGHTDRKRLLRALIASVTLTAQRDSGQTVVTIAWQNGLQTSHTVARVKPGHPADKALVTQVRQLAAAGHSDDAIADALNAAGMVSSWHVKDDPTYVAGRPVAYWSRTRVRRFRYKHAILLDPAAVGLFPATTVAATLGVSVGVLLDWFRRGLLQGRQRQPGYPVWIQFDAAVRARIDGCAPRALLTDAEPPLIALPVAAAHFGLTDADLTAALRAGALLAWRLPYGRHFRWYVQANPASAPQSAEGDSL